MDKLFRIVFKNKVIKNKIFNLIRENNEFISSQKNLVFKKYNQCNVKWCVLNKQFNLLLYKLSKELKIRNQFTNTHFHYFLEHNTELELLKQIFQIYPNLIPTTINEKSIVFEKCSFSSSKLFLPSYRNEKNHCYKQKNKQEIIKYLIKELKIKPTKQTLYNLCIDGENITSIKSMFNQGYFSIKKDCDIGLVYCSLKAKDFQFYKLILENNPILKKELQNMDNYILNLLLASTCNVEFYKYSFDELLKDEDKILQVVHHGLATLYHLNPIAIQFGNMEIIEYLCNNFHLYPKEHISKCLNKSIQSITFLNEDGIGDGITPLELLKYFLNHPKIEINIQHAQEAFRLFAKKKKLDCLGYLKQVYGDEMPIVDLILCQTLTIINFEIETFKWLISYNDGITTKVNCSVDTFNSIIESLSIYTSLPYKTILDFILLDSNCQITDGDIANAITNYRFSLNDRNKYEYLCSFIKNDCLKPLLTH